MSKLFWLLLIGGFIYWRQQRAKKIQPKIYTEPFDGKVLEIGESYIGVIDREDPEYTVICAHGFMENMMYLRKLYDDENVQFISINNSGYHAPVDTENYEKPEWATPPPFKAGTIEYDAYVLNMALENLPRSVKIRIHGHSRGGAVTTEAILTRPDLHKNRNIEYILEAPILPHSVPAIPAIIMFNPVAQLFIPFTFTFLKGLPDEKRAKYFASGRPGYKKDFLNNVFFNPKTYKVIDTNILNMWLWARKRPLSALNDMPNCKIYIGSKDTILSSSHMRNVAAKVNWLEPVECKGSHWQAFDNPELFKLN